MAGKLWRFGLAAGIALFVAFGVLFLKEQLEVQHCYAQTKRIRPGMATADLQKFMKVDGRLLFFSAKEELSRLAYSVRGCHCGRQGQVVKVEIDSKVIHCDNSCQEVVAEVSEPRCELPAKE